MEGAVSCNLDPPLSKRQRSMSASPSSGTGGGGDHGNMPQITTLSSWWQKSCRRASSTCTATCTGQHQAAATGTVKKSPPYMYPHRLLLLDLRPAADQLQRPLAGIHRREPPHPSLVIASLPLEQVKARSFELPARHVHFAILVEGNDDDDLTHVQTAKQFLLQPDRVAANKNRKFRPWQVDNILVADHVFWEEAREIKLVENGAERGDTTNGTNGGPALAPSPRLWDADGMVENVLLPLLRNEIAGTNHRGKRLRIYDMASGAGRDAVFLAEELLHSSTRCSSGAQFHCTAIDHRYNAKQTNIVQDFFHRRGVGDYTSVVKANLSKWETMREILLSARRAHGSGGCGGTGGDDDEDGDDTQTTSNNSGATVDVLYCVRFLVRSAIKDLASCSSLHEGTIFAISHFSISQDGGVWPFEHPSPETVLERNEMKDLFMANGWNVLHDDIATDSDHGRTLLHFVARKK